MVSIGEKGRRKRTRTGSRRVESDGTSIRISQTSGTRRGGKGAEGDHGNSDERPELSDEKKGEDEVVEPGNSSGSAKTSRESTEKTKGAHLGLTGANFSPISYPCCC